ncbi:hypothetical protein BDV98DRAFT_339634 [Pterulicium gracile]|uniref:Uncharacterized protein n=1 Tax=Pterulicium gracile TaxID=1884261 RepID=A0A5C3Q538_9AGAR|nr:hypothetical protein BDV98DRAFT_339634 [Pterula gracilis]
MNMRPSSSAYSSQKEMTTVEVCCCCSMLQGERPRILLRSQLAPDRRHNLIPHPELRESSGQKSSRKIHR